MGANGCNTRSPSRLTPLPHSHLLRQVLLHIRQEASLKQHRMLVRRALRFIGFARVAGADRLRTGLEVVFGSTKDQAPKIPGLDVALTASGLASAAGALVSSFTVGLRGFFPVIGKVAAAPASLPTTGHPVSVARLASTRSLATLLARL